MASYLKLDEYGLAVSEGVNIYLQVLKSGLHIALKSEDYVSGIRQSILAGGDSTSR